MREVLKKSFDLVGSQIQDTNFSPDNKAKGFLLAHADIISLSVFNHSKAEFSQHTQEKIKRAKEVSKKDFTIDTVAGRQYLRLKKDIEINLSFLSIVEDTLEVLSKKSYEHLNFDAIHWETYKHLKERISQLEEQNNILSKVLLEKLEFINGRRKYAR